MGTRGLVNEYTCEVCKKRTHTINLSTGTTPFIIACPICRKGGAQSGAYNVQSNAVYVALCFYRPGFNEFQTLGYEEQVHVLKGGLLLGELGKEHVLNSLDHAADQRPINANLWLSRIVEIYNPSKEIFDEIKKDLGL